MPTREIELDFNSPFNCYDVVEHDGYVYFAGQHYDGNASFADGEGPGLFRRERLGSGVPAAVAGSSTYRFYALTSFGGNLVALGCLTADVAALAGSTPAISWNANPPPDLYVFVSADGLTWTSYNMGQLETALGTADEEDGQYPGSLQNLLMETAATWVRGLTQYGVACVRIVIGSNVITWTGTAPPMVASAGSSRYGGITTAHGCTYLTTGRYQVEFREGLLVVHDTTATGSDSLLARGPVLADDDPTTLAPSSMTALVEFTGGVMMAAGNYYGRWVLVFSPDPDTGDDVDSKIGALTMPHLPRSEPLTVDCSKLATIEKADDDTNSRWYDRTLGGDDPMCVRFAEGMAYVIQKTDMFDTDAGIDTQPVFRVPLVDFPAPVDVDGRRVWIPGPGTAPGAGDSADSYSESLAYRVETGDKFVYFQHDFGENVNWVRLGFHEMDLTVARAVLCGVRGDSSDAVNDLDTYLPVDPLHNVLLPAPAQVVDVVVIVRGAWPGGYDYDWDYYIYGGWEYDSYYSGATAADVIGPVSLVGHVEEA